MATTANNTTEIGLVLQGGGALGAYEYGAVTALLELIDAAVAKGHDVTLKAVTGVSIGAVNAACVVGSANRLDARRRLAALWNDFALSTPFFWPARIARDLSLYGLPRFWRVRRFFPVDSWTTMLVNGARLYRLLRRERIDLVHTVAKETLNVRNVALVARAAGVPVDVRGGAPAVSPETGAVRFEGISHAMERSVPAEPSETADRFYRGKRVLITHGGESLGPALARELVSLGADVTVHVASAWERARFSEVTGDHVTFRAGALDREVDVAHMLEASDPQVVFHAVPVRTPGVANETGYVFRRGARSSQTLSATVGRSRVESLVLVSFWESARPEDRWALLSTLGEVVVLNDPALVRASPKVLRLPSVLTEERFRRIGRTERSEETRAERFDMLESEAVAVVLNTGTVCAGRTIVVPISSSSFGVEDVDGVLRKAGASPVRSNAGRVSNERRPLFPNETPRPSVIPGTEQVVSPLYPASAALLDAVSGCLHGSGGEELEDCLKTLAADLNLRAEALRTVGL